MAQQWKAEAWVKHYTARRGLCATAAWVYGKTLNPFIRRPDVSQRTGIQTSALQRHVQVREGTFILHHDTIYAQVLVTHCVRAYIHLFPGWNKNNREVC